MKPKIISTFGLALLANVTLVSPVKAIISISWTSIGNAGNAADTTGYGAVSNPYNISTYDVTNAQYVEFLNAKGASNSYGIYNSTIGGTGTSGSNITQSGSSGSYTYSVNNTYANQPVGGVTWFDAARFCNWLSNGQGSGSTETGAYTLNGALSGIILANANAQIRLPTEDEWYKAAYYNGGTGTYSLYADGRNNITSADANYLPSATGLVNVNYGTPSSYGVYGQAGNVWQWNDAVISGSWRGARGGSWNDVHGNSALASSYRTFGAPSSVNSGFGFRVAGVPEPTSGVLTILASGMLLIRRKR